MIRNSVSLLKERMAGAKPVLVAAVLLLAMTAPAGAQNVTIGFGEGAGVTERAIQLIALITVLSLAPSILIMVTSLTRIVVVLSLLRTAIGVQQSPPNTVVISLALFLTAFVTALFSRRPTTPASGR